MPRKDDSTDQSNDLEVMVGNKLLLSMLFLVMVLLGVFFGMGYLAGKGTSGEVKTVEAATAAKPAPFRAAAEAASEKASEVTPNPVPQDPPAVTEARRQLEEKPLPAEPKISAPLGGAAAAADLAAPRPGKYLQASALPRKQAEVLSREFRKGGLPSQIVLSPKKPKPGAEPLYRVLVGPLADSSVMSQARLRLKEKGINSPIPVTY